jgi:hypothetical protein
MAYLQQRSCDRNDCGGPITCIIKTADGQTVGSYCAAHGKDVLKLRNEIEERMLRVQENQRSRG